jgi:hypothetical protein
MTAARRLRCRRVILLSRARHRARVRFVMSRNRNAAAMLALSRQTTTGVPEERMHGTLRRSGKSTPVEGTVRLL